MKKYLLYIFTFICIIISLYLVYDYSVYYNGGLYLTPKQELHSFTKTQDEKLWIDQGGGFEVFDIKGVKLGLAKPGNRAEDYAITQEEYLRWFKQIQELGANVISLSTVAHGDFYRAFYEYNKDNSKPLYLIHGIKGDDYLLNSHRDAFDEQLFDDFLKKCKNVVDITHGRHKSFNFSSLGFQSYKQDISPWVYGYILGDKWPSDLLVFTNKTGIQQDQFKGKYLSTQNAENFEIFLAMIGDELITYETDKYKEQRTLAFASDPLTDPFVYPEKIAIHLKKFASINTEKILVSDEFIGGQYVAYDVYPYSPEFEYYLQEADDPAQADETDQVNQVNQANQAEGFMQNTYLTYLTRLKEHHQSPLLISEFGIPSSRGMQSYEQEEELARNQGFMSEEEQGKALASLYQDIEASACAGGIVREWQDQWYKSSSNTVQTLDLNRAAYWSDYQTNAQSYGLLSFDPGLEQSICYVDGDKTEWLEEDLVSKNRDYRLSMKYDEKFIYFLAEKENFNPLQDKLYIPIDLTPKSGSNYIDQCELQTSHATDFVIEINTTEDSRVWVHERYNTKRANSERNKVYEYAVPERTPAKDSPRFNKLLLSLDKWDYYNNGVPIPFSSFSYEGVENIYALPQTYESGKLKHGNANPQAEDFNSLADFSFGENLVEIKIPWGLLNFSDPTNMNIHDDYYETAGVENLSIQHMNLGIGDNSQIIEMNSFNLEKLGDDPDYHERLKESYYILQEYWTKELNS